MNRVQQVRVVEPVHADALFRARGRALPQHRHAHLEEFVDVGAEDRQEQDALQHRIERVLRFLQHALLKLEQAQFPIAEQARLVQG